MTHGYHGMASVKVQIFSPFIIVSMTAFAFYDVDVNRGYTSNKFMVLLF